MKHLPQFAIRNLFPADAAEAASLSAELGYPVAVDVMEKRLERLSTMPDHAVFGAAFEQRLVAWIDVGIVHHLQSGSYGEIGGLIVSAKHQGYGIGRALVERAEQWIAAQDVKTVLVRSQIARKRSHAFYLNQGFSQTKTSAVFSKPLD